MFTIHLHWGTYPSELDQLLRKRHAVTVSGLANETAKAMIISHLLTLHPRSAVVVTEDLERCEGLLHWLTFFGQEAFHVQFGEEPTSP